MGRQMAGRRRPAIHLLSLAYGQKLSVALVDEHGKPVKPQDIQYVVANKVWPPEAPPGKPRKLR